jgi:arabinose-5-phosphate isomerase
MSLNPITLPADTRAVDALTRMKQAMIGQLLVTDEQGQLVGALNMHDFLTAGVS